MCERAEEDPARAWEGVRAALDRGLAPILSTDLAELPYHASRTRFGGHRVVLAGYDAARGVALARRRRPARRSRRSRSTTSTARAASIAPPFGASGRPWLEVDAPPRPRTLAEAVPEALRRQAREVLLDVDGAAGVSALERFAAELPEWPARAAGEADRAWCFRYGYQVIEKRGTGGGLFRALYAAFLEEAERAMPALATPRPRRRGCARSPQAGRGSPAAFRAISEVPGGLVPPPVRELARALARDERRYHEDVAALGPVIRMTVESKARARFAALLERDPVPLDEAALAIAEEEYPRLEPEEVPRPARRARRARAAPRRAARRAPPRLLHALRKVLFEEEGLPRERGRLRRPAQLLPERGPRAPARHPHHALASLYIEVARRVGLPLRASASPATSSRSTPSPSGTEVFVDAFNGGEMLVRRRVRRPLPRAHRAGATSTGATSPRSRRARSSRGCSTT